MNILYGGAFNPPTLAHFNIIKYLVENYPQAKLIILPASKHYKEGIVAYYHRKRMLEIILKDLKANLVISNYEQRQRKFQGTFATLQHFLHPYFVIGADQILELQRWLNFPQVIIENKFIVFPRNDINGEEYILQDPILREYYHNFTFIKNFPSLNISSSQYRRQKDPSLLNAHVNNYILTNKLYQSEKRGA